MADTETFEDLLDAYVGEVAEGWGGEKERQAILDYVKRLEANQITPDIITAYETWRDMRKIPFLRPDTELQNAYSLITTLSWVIDPDGTYERLNGHKRGEE